MALDEIAEFGDRASEGQAVRENEAGFSVGILAGVGLEFKD